MVNTIDNITYGFYSIKYLNRQIYLPNFEESIQ